MKPTFVEFYHHPGTCEEIIEKIKIPIHYITSVKILPFCGYNVVSIKMLTETFYLTDKTDKQKYVDTVAIISQAMATVNGDGTCLSVGGNNLIKSKG